uniref:Replication-associated protein ORF2/G2P domain-containing protein n=1 Tax=uncultured prokaryote TaxID=198431 RepID=A0A0H5Q0M4_9ZZZZ|nr:hypothetical protein [uncultured prokaryote]
MEVKKLSTPIQILDGDTVRLKEMGNITEIMFSKKRSLGGYITKIDKDHYIDNRTGEFLEFKHLENRAQDLSNVAKSLARGRDILNANIVDVSHCRWVTLTYADNMTNPKKLFFDFKNFNKRCRSVYGHYQYIVAAEPQGRGAWHLHCVFIFDNKAPYMENAVVRDCWKQGFVTVKRLDNVDNVGAYLTAYLGDMELSEAVSVFHEKTIYSSGVKEVDYVDENGLKRTKYYIKGARLCMYPPGFHIFRWSKGIKKPDVSFVSYKTAKEKASSAKLTFTKTVSLEDAETTFKNTIQYEYYNSIRK